MAKLTPQEQADKLARRLKSATQDIQRGIERTTVAPGQQAAKAVQKMRQNINEAIDSGRWAKKVSSVSLSDWQQKAINKGIGRIAAGVDEAMPRLVEVATNLQSVQNQIDSKIASMPSMTLQDNINRMVTQVSEMAKAKGKI
jgi:alanyl-tRNA synthetase